MLKCNKRNWACRNNDSTSFLMTDLHFYEVLFPLSENTRKTFKTYKRGERITIFCNLARETKNLVITQTRLAINKQRPVNGNAYDWGKFCGCVDAGSVLVTLIEFSECVPLNSLRQLSVGDRDIWKCSKHGKFTISSQLLFISKWILSVY